MSHRLLAIGLFAALLPGLRAQTADPATRELIERLLARIDGLEKRVADLEKGGVMALASNRAAPAAPAPVSPPAAAPAQTPTPSAAEAMRMSHDQPPVPLPQSESAQPVYPSLKIAGFGDIDYSATTFHGAVSPFRPQTLVEPYGGFEEGQFTLQLSSALSPKVAFFGELTLTARDDAGTGTPPAPGFNAEVERVIIRYDLNDYFKLSFGRYHTPINYWNTAFHHGQWLQTTISRPEMTQFGGSFIPVHFVGTLVEGAVPASGLNLNYNFGLGNGRGEVISRPGDFGDINNNRAWLANLFVKPDQLYGLQVGGSVYHDELNPLIAPAAREWIQSAHIVWQKETPEFIAEFANVTHEPIGGGVASNSQAYYVQTAYRLPFGQKLWKPYFRFESIHVPKSDPIFTPLVPTFSGATIGLRYDISSFAAFKWEYRHYTVRDLPNINGLFVQTSFTF
jgi:hypothetical protein